MGDEFLKVAEIARSLKLKPADDAQLDLIGGYLPAVLSAAVCASDALTFEQLLEASYIKTRRQMCRGAR